MIRILYLDEQGDLQTNLTVDDLAETWRNKAGLLWVDFGQEPEATVESILSDTFGFHPLAVDDALHESHVPKVDDWQDYLYIVLRQVAYAGIESDQLIVPELDVFLGRTYVVTYHKEPIVALDQVWALCQTDQRWLRLGAGRLLYRLVDQLVSEAIASEEQMRDDLDRLEDQIFSTAKPESLEQLFDLKRNTLQMRRIVVPSRDVLNKLSRNEYAVTDGTDRVFFRDVYDHFIQLDTLLEDMLILVGGTLDAYLSVVNNRMNDVMKTLTVITAFFMPLAFITGFFGMNFFQSPNTLHAWTGQVVFVAILALMVLIPLFMFWWARRRAWI
jgi:magnesium transporter